MTTTIPLLIRALRWALCILAAGAAFAIATAAGDPSHASPMARIQRRATAEAATTQNAVGEITYSIDEPGAATLRVGTSDSGTVVVSDPCAIHIAPRRKLEPEEYSIRVSGAHTAYPDGSILLATNILNGAVTNVITVTPTDSAVKLSSVSWDIAWGGSVGRVRDTTEDVATCRVTTTYDTPPPPSERVPGWSVLRGVVVWAWTSDRRTIELDTETHPVPYRDALGATSLWDLRAWTTNRYDWRTAEHWAEFPADSTIRLGGHTVHYSAGGALRSMVDSGTWTYYASGVPVIEIVSGVSTNSATDEINILAITLEGTNAVIDINASLGVPVYVDSAPDLVSGEWFRVIGQSSSYPETVTVGGITAYRITVPLDPSATSAFYRATATVDGSGATRTLKLGGESTALYIDGVKCAWTNLVVNGATLCVLAAQPD